MSTTTVAAIGERELIARLTRGLARGPDVVVGVGDDCAVVRSPSGGASEWLLTSDPVIAGVHFQAKEDPRRIGAKAVGRVLSDLAAMGGEPLWGLINLVLPPETPVTWAERLYEGVRAQADRFGLHLVGGDVAEGPRVELHVFAVGQCPTGTSVQRATATVGDHLFVTGPLGGSFRKKHLDFTPRVTEGQWLRPWAHAMINITDGLLTDLRHLIERPGLGVLLREADIPLAPEALIPDGRTALDHALTDGEDFELLFTVEPHRVAAFTAAWQARFAQPVANIGLMTAESGCIRCQQQDGTESLLTGDGFEHFRVRNA